MLPDDVWQVTYDGVGKVREGAWVAEPTGVLGLSGWPNGMRGIARSDNLQAGHAETSPRSTVRPAGLTARDQSIGTRSNAPPATCGTSEPLVRDAFDIVSRPPSDTAPARNGCRSPACRRCSAGPRKRPWSRGGHRGLQLRDAQATWVSWIGSILAPVLGYVARNQIASGASAS